MLNFLDQVKENPSFYKQLSVDDQLITEYNCPLNSSKEKLFTPQGYFVYVIEGRKIWHIPGQSFELTAGKCIFVKKGAHIVEQFFDTRFCVVVFFVSEKFITETIRNSQEPKSFNGAKRSGPITPIDTDDSLHAFFNSVVPYFLNSQEVNKVLLELKFKELILNVISNPKNEATTSYFHSLLIDSFSDCIRTILEENFRSNLGIEEYARLCNRSLSAFKRDFEEHFSTTPGRWLLKRRLQHAQLLLNTSSQTISEIAFDSGFENVSHFSKAFKTQNGKSPMQYRQAYLNVRAK